MTLTTTAQQLATISMAARAPRPCVVDHGYAWLAAGMSGVQVFEVQAIETFQGTNSKHETRRLRRRLT